MIHFQCPACGLKLKAIDGAEGRASRCKCGQDVTVPYPAIAAPQVFPTVPQVIYVPVPVLPPEPLPVPVADDFAFDVPRCRDADLGPLDRNYRTITTQKTSKFWKIQILLSSLFAIGGFAAFACACGGIMSDPHPNKPAAAGPDVARMVALVGFGCFLLGLTWLVVARVGAWWDHG